MENTMETYFPGPFPQSQNMMPPQNQNPYADVCSFNFFFLK